MSQDREPMTPDQPAPPGTPEPPDLDVDPEQFLDERTVPAGEDVNPDAGTPEPSG